MSFADVALDHPGWHNLMDAVADVFPHRTTCDLWTHPHEQGRHSPLYLRIVHQMRHDGAALSEIADTLGVTTQAVWLALRRPVCCPPDTT